MVPSYPQLKIRADVTDRLSLEPEHEAVLPSARRKRIWHVPGAFSDEPVSLGAILVIQPGSELAVRPVRGRGSVLGLLEHLYAARFIGRWGLEEVHLERCGALARRVRILALTRPSNPESIEQTTDRIERLFA